MSKNDNSQSSKRATKRAQGRRTKESAKLTVRDYHTAHTLAAIMRDPAASAAVADDIGRVMCDLENETQTRTTHPSVIATVYLVAVSIAREFIAGTREKTQPLSGRPQLLKQHIRDLDRIAKRYEFAGLSDEGLPLFFGLAPDVADLLKRDAERCLRAPKDQAALILETYYGIADSELRAMPPTGEKTLADPRIIPDVAALLDAPIKDGRRVQPLDWLEQLFDATGVSLYHPDFFQKAFLMAARRIELTPRPDVMTSDDPKERAALLGWWAHDAIRELLAKAREGGAE